MKCWIYLNTIGIALLLMGCATTKIELTPFTVEAVSITAQPEANNDLAIPIDIVFTNDRETLEDLEGFTASGWEAVKGTNLGDWEGKIFVKSLEVKPGDLVRITEFPEGYADALGVVIFANYKRPGLHRLIFTGVREIDLILGEATLMSDNGKPYLLTSPPKPPEPSQPSRY